MSNVIRLLIVVAAFFAMVTVAYLVMSSFGIKRGSWQDVILRLAVPLTVFFVWYGTAPKNRPPSSPDSN
jgi:hypothetical protein